MLRRISVLAAAAVAFGVLPVAATAQSNDRFAGTWRAAMTINGMQCTLTVAMTTTATYVENDRCGPYATGQSGTYRTFPNGLLVRTVTDWTPRQRYIVDAGGGGHYETNAKPPGGTYRVTFTSNTTMVWRDANMGGVATFHRVL